MSKRPTWDFKTDQGLAEWLHCHRVIRIDWVEEIDGSYHAYYYLTLYPERGKPFKKTLLELSHNEYSPEVHQQTDNRGLLVLREDLKARLDAIKHWDSKHKAERTTYERLKKKFGDVEMVAGEEI